MGVGCRPRVWRPNAGRRPMIRDDAALDEILDELEHAEAGARRAAHALAEAEEAAEEDAASRAEVDACRARLEAAEALVAELRRRRQASGGGPDRLGEVRGGAPRGRGGRGGAGGAP